MKRPDLILILFNKIKAEIRPRAVQLDYIVKISKLKTQTNISATLELRRPQASVLMNSEGANLFIGNRL